MKSIGSVEVLLLFCFLYPTMVRAEERITLYYNERPPYLTPAADGSATGLTATPTANAFKAAGIPSTWAMVPTNRQLLNIKRNAAPDCAVGWFKNPEREQFAKFTNAIYRDARPIALANKSFKVQDGAKLNEVLATKGLRVLVKENFSYGRIVDDMLARFKPALVYTTNENGLMAKMILLGHADLMFAAEEEANFLAERAGFGANQFQIIRFPDLLNGEKRHIMCSKRVPDEIIQRLNEAIDFEPQDRDMRSMEKAQSRDGASLAK